MAVRLGRLPVMLCRAVWGNLQSSTCKEGHRSSVETRKSIIHSFTTEVIRQEESLTREEISTGRENEVDKKKKEEESAGCQQWNERRTRCAERGLTGCLAPSVCAAVAGVWWICSQPARGGYQESVACQRRGRTGGETQSAGGQRPCESLWSAVNWSLWGQGPWLKRMRHEAWLFQKYIPFHLDWKRVYSGCAKLRQRVGKLDGSRFFMTGSDSNQREEKEHL